MPIFQDDLGSTRGTPPGLPAISPLFELPTGRRTIERKVSEESIRTELCEGLLPDSPEDLREIPAERPDISYKFPTHSTSDRGELIELLKRGESPTWFPNRNLESLLHDLNRTPQKPSPSNASPLLPSPEITKSERPTSEDLKRLQAGLQIERPRSALHSGDFTENSLQHDDRDVDSESLDSQLYRSEKSPWLSTSPPRNFSPFQSELSFQPAERYGRPEFRSRAPSLSSSLSSSFLMKPPTSPLVQSQSNEDLDLSSDRNPIDIKSDFQKGTRRHTLHMSGSAQTVSSISSSSFDRPLPHLRRDNTYPYQAHQPRRSPTSNLLQQAISSPQTPDFLRSRRPSYSETSPLHASMVGSYEESILRGRMSTTPSRPLDFVAQIGVLGLGKCKSSLKCPAHVTIPFPAVFYSYETTAHGRAGKSEDGPSPYVGQIDIEGTLESQENVRDKKRKRHTASTERARADDFDTSGGANSNRLNEHIRRAEKQKRRSTSPRAPPGGSYRIPEKGQLQIVIKNPNKTAVKLFLVPYDLAGMEAGTKTFIRQRIYSGGPIMEIPLSSTSDTPSAKPLDRSTLRYLVHLHICCPSRGRFFLYKSIRVVFANRVPDGKEKLRVEISLPEPRFTVYKPGRDSSFGLGSTSGGNALTAEKAYRRRSSGFALGPSSRTYDTMDGITQALEKGFSASPAVPSNESGYSLPPIQPIPFIFARKPIRTGDDVGQERQSNLQSPTSSKGSRPQTSLGDSGMSWRSDSTGFSGGYDKLNKGDVGYGGNLFASSPDGKQGMSQGLLAKKLRDFSMVIQEQRDRLNDVSDI